MALSIAMCTHCGGTLQIDNGVRAAVCPYCRQTFIVADAINKYLSTQAVPVAQPAPTRPSRPPQNSELDRLLEAGNSRLRLGYTEDACQNFQNAVDQYPGEWKCWWGLMQAAIVRMGENALYHNREYPLILNCYKNIESLTHGKVPAEVEQTYQRVKAVMQDKKEKLDRAESKRAKEEDAAKARYRPAILNYRGQINALEEEKNAANKKRPKASSKREPNEVLSFLLAVLFWGLPVVVLFFFAVRFNSFPIGFIAAGINLGLYLAYFIGRAVTDSAKNRKADRINKAADSRISTLRDEIYRLEDAQIKAIEAISQENNKTVQTIDQEAVAALRELGKELPL